MQTCQSLLCVLHKTDVHMFLHTLCVLLPEYALHSNASHVCGRCSRLLWLICMHSTFYKLLGANVDSSFRLSVVYF